MITNSQADDSGTLCIRLLRDAEIRGQQIVTAARGRKVKRIKQARIQAEIEINQFREMRESRLREKEASLKQESTLRGVEISVEAQNELDRMKKRVKSCTYEVIDMLETLTCHIEPTLHYNIHIRKEIEENEDYSRDHLKPNPIIEKVISKCLTNCEKIAENLFPDDNNNKAEEDSEA